MQSVKVSCEVLSKSKMEANDNIPEKRLNWEASESESIRASSSFDSIEDPFEHF